jgi:hypothetical protein
VMQRSRLNPDGTYDFETEAALGTDGRYLKAAGGWAAWDFILPPPAGIGVGSLDPSRWTAPSIRGPCQACSQSFTISTGVLGLSSFGGGLLQMARAGKGGNLQRSCFTKRK